VTAAGLTVGAIGTIVSLLALFYAALAARRSDALLRRLVIYPFRELDISLAKLTDTERCGLLELYSTTSDGKRLIDGDILATARARVPELTPAMLSFLIRQEWLQPVDKASYRLNRDRLPYLHFVLESESN
jgi:hypothetical protein